MLPASIPPTARHSLVSINSELHLPHMPRGAVGLKGFDISIPLGTAPNSLCSLRAELLVQRRRADAAQYEAEHEVQRRPPANGVNGKQEDDAALRRELALASSEIEALRVHVADLRTRIHSGYWSWQTCGRWGGSIVDNDGYDVNGTEAGLSGRRPGAHMAAAAAAASSAALKDIGIGGMGSGNHPNSTLEVSRLQSMLTEKNEQVNVLIATVDTLQVTTAKPPSPRSNNGRILGGSGSSGVSASPCHRKTHDRPRVDLDLSLSQSADAVDGGVGILNHISAQGLVRHCVALAVRLTSTMSRAWGAERRADRLTAELERRESELRAAETIATNLAENNRLLDVNGRKTTAALKGMKVECATRLREAGEEASKLR